MRRFLLPIAVSFSILAVPVLPAVAQVRVQIGLLAPSTDNRDQQRIAELARGATEGGERWRASVEEFLRGEGTDSFGDRAAITARGRELMRAIDDQCGRDGCVRDRAVASPITAVARMTSGAACSAIPIDGVPVRDWTMQPGTIAYDFQPLGARPAAGVIPIVPGDQRLGGGRTGRIFSDRIPLTGDALDDVRSFEAVGVPRGRLRVIVMAAVRETLVERNNRPFGSRILANEQAINVMPVDPDNWLSRGALRKGSAEATFAPGNVLPGRVPTVVFEVNNARDALSLVFPAGAEIGAIVVELASQPSSFELDARARTGGVSTPEQCLVEQARIDRATGGAYDPQRLLAREPAALPVSRS